VPARSSPPSGAGTVPQAKQHATLRRYALRRLRLPLGGGSLSMVVPDAGDWIRRGQWTEAAERGAEPPYWVQVWPASVAVARLLWRQGGLAGRRVLDLGCGLGVPGLAAAAAGAHATFADREADALAFAQWNGEQIAPGRIAAQRLDWSREVLAGSFDVVVMADVSYRPVHHHALHRHVASCLLPGGVVVHADPHRREATPFVQALGERLPMVVATRDTAVEDRRVPVRLCVAGRDEAVLRAWQRTLGDPPAVEACARA
jgi:predicted nicotinamide N-methyase